MRVKAFLLSYLCVLSVAFVSGQTKKTYGKEWRRIDSLLEKAGLFQSAAKEIDKIYSAAKKEKNEVQVIKSLVYKMAIRDRLTEEGRYENMRMLEKEIATAAEPAKSILHSIAGGSYWRYLQQNRWQFYNRTPGRAYDKDDIATWDLQQLYQTITDHYTASLKNKDVLTSTRVSSIEPLLIKGNSRKLRPVLYDLLAHRALEFFRNDERYINKPAYAFEISDSMAFADAGAFATHVFRNTDTLSLHHQAITLFQELLSFHLSDTEKGALLDADIARLQFVHQFSTHPEKEELYGTALQKLATRYASEPMAADAMLLLAQWYMTKGNSYDPVGDTTNRYALVEAKKWCERALATKNNSEGKSNAAGLLKQILAKHITLKTEKVNLPGEPFRVLVNYRNTTSAHLRLIKIGQELKRALASDSWKDSLWGELLALPAIREQSVTLPDTKDHQMHRTELKIDPLPVGEYALVSSNEKEWTLKSESLSVSFFHVSSLAYVQERYRYYVLDRKSGLPVADAAIQVWKETHNYQTKRTALQRVAKYRSDTNGFFELKHPRVNERSNFRLEITKGNDRFFPDDYAENYIYSDYLPAVPDQRVFLFSDRSIYRPGQTIYFKGIAIQTRAKKDAAIITGRKSVVRLINANGVPVDSLILTTNDFGSYSGKFTLPSSQLNGQFRITDGDVHGETYFQVEEYKRPKFFVDIKKPGGTYRLNDSLRVEGAATSYAGNAIGGATVSYRVVRRVNIPLWTRSYDKRIWPPYPGREMEIAHGTATTDEKGKFFIPFTAIPDRHIPREQHPQFHYEITADVTDINGETRSGNAGVSVAYESLVLDIGIAETIKTDSLKNVILTSKNMNDSLVPTNARLSIYKLAAPGRVFRERYWEQADQFVMSREDYYRHFPLDMYANETDPKTWQKEKTIFESVLTTHPEKGAAVPGKTMAPGWYLFEAEAKDPYNQPVLVKKYVLLVGDKLVSPIATSIFDVNRTTAAPGDKVSYSLLSNIEDLHIIHELVRNEDTSRSQAGNISGKNLTISTNDRNNIFVNAVFVKNNRVYSRQFFIDVQRTDKMLKIDYSTYRNKTLPGSRETWKVKISGMKGEKAAAELITAMYDASLDQFNPHGWRIPSVFEKYYYTGSWNGADNFTAVESLEKYELQPGGEVFQKTYDRLRTFDEGTGVEMAIRGRVSGVRVMDAAAPVANEEVATQSFSTKRNKSEAVQSDGGAREMENDAPAIQPRTNLQETAFFFPHLYTDSMGNVEFSFTAPEALTTWKWMLMAHTKELAFGSGEQTILTQKELMVQPNMPRFLREGDDILLTAKIANMGNSVMSGESYLSLTDAITGKNIDDLFLNKSPSQKFSVAAGQSAPLTFRLTIPKNYTSAVTWKIMATANKNSYSDGEESILPIISDKMLVTETLPLPVRNVSTKNFSFGKLLNSAKSNTLVQRGLTIEFTSNPTWYAVQALPYLTQPANENAEQAFNRFYANAIAAHLVQSIPRLKSIIGQWKQEDSSAFLSNLQKNEELKTVLLQETPWVLAARSESQQKKNIALLFDMVRMSSELNAALSRLQDMQSPTGGFVWFKGGPEDRYMTQYIVAGIGRLRKLSAIPEHTEQALNTVVSKALAYLDQQIKDDYTRVRADKKKFVPPAGNVPVHYLYARSFFTNIPVAADATAAFRYYRDLAKKEWRKNSTYMKGMIALSLFRTGDKQHAANILASLKESAIVHEETGMYWKDMIAGYYWYQAPVETQSLLIEVFSEIGTDTVSLADMKTWLLKNKQTNNWQTSKSTADACYALLLEGGQWVNASPEVAISLGDHTVRPDKTQAGTGYFKTYIPGDSVKPSLGNIQVRITPSNMPAWGSVYWQYFEEMDKITPAGGALSVKKELFLQKNSDRGPVITPFAGNHTLRVGDRIKVRMEIRTDRAMEYVHLKDMRASGFEPVNVISGYKWQGGLGYYEATGDASTNFYFHYLPKGVHIFEYDLFVAHAGTFSNGITTIQCMYAPEFASHSEGIKVNVNP